MLPQSFLLSEVVTTPSMVPTPPVEPTMGLVASTSRVVDTDVTSSAMSWMVTLVLGSPSFSASDLMVSRVELARVFRLTSTLFDHGSVIVTTTEVCEGVNVGQLVARDVVEQPMISCLDSPCQVVVVNMNTLPT
jgi:hypothetical protein